MILHAVLASFVFLGAWLMTRVIRQRARVIGLIDVPNERSSHTTSVPRGGGLSIVCATLAGAVVLAIRGGIDVPLAAALVAGGAIVAGIGLRDDYKQVHAATRLVAHFVAAGIGTWLMDGLPVIHVAGNDVQLGWAGYLLAVLAIVWSINLFNFMDGIDGLAASQAAFVAVAGAVLAAMTDTSSPVVVIALILGFASLGFLVCNWPPARIFMGDVGSGFLGFAIALLALAHARENPAAPFIWAILGAAFVCDATVTLVTRALAGRRVYQAHRSHAYQKLTIRAGSHRPVTVGVIALNLAFVLPCAVLASLFPAWAVWLALIAMVPLAILAIILRAGREGV